MLLGTLIGLFLGIVSGLLPGLGSTSILLLFFPLLIQLDPLNLLIVYISLVISSQYVASVTAIYTGIPGAESATSTAKEFTNIKKLNLTSTAIKQNAKSALIGNIIGISLFIAITPIFHYITNYYKVNIKLAILSLIFIVLYLSTRKVVSTTLTIFFAGFLSYLGYDNNTKETFNLGLSFLDNGIPWVTLIMAPIIGNSIKELYLLKYDKINYTKNEKDSKLNYPSCLRGSIFGFFIGFVPGLSYILSSIVTYLLEKKIVKNKTEDQIVLNSIAASESAHSSGIIAMLIPFLVIGIPITSSEAVIMNMLTINTTMYDLVNQLLDNLWIIALVIVSINLLSYLIAQYSSGLVQLFMSLDNRIFSLTLFSLGLISIYYSLDYNYFIGFISYLLLVYLFFRFRIDPLVFIITALLYPTISNNIYYYYQLNS